jgi:predicted phage terminase large subunit-like protein
MNLGMRYRKSASSDRVLRGNIAAAEAASRLHLLNTSKQVESKGFRDWLWEVSPAWKWDLIHLQYTRYFLDKVTRGLIKKLMVFMPPRHGKSEHGSIRYPAYRLELDPTLRCMLVCHSQPLANKFSRDMRKIVSQRVEMNKDKRSAREWETRAGGGLYAVGIGGVGGGLGFGLIVLDDVIKNAKVAQSPAFRESLWDSYRKDIKTRLSPNGAMILTYTRWHLQDLGGMILASDEAADWVVIRLPALAEPGDPLGRPEGMALWPDQWNRKHLLALLRDDPYGFGALYQQNPSPSSGDIFEAGWFLDPDCYIAAVPRGCRWVRYWDKAGTEGGGGAFTAGVLMAKTQDGLYIVVDVVRGRWKAHEREKQIKATAQRDGPNVAVWVEQEPGSGGKESAENTVINLAGFNVRAEPVRGDKTTRALPMAGQASVGNLVLLRDTEGHRWNRDFIDELIKFPQGTFKDQVDAAAGAFNKLALVPAVLAAEVSGPSIGIEHTALGALAYPDPLAITGQQPGGVVWGGDPEIWTPGGGLGGIQGHVDPMFWSGGVI